MADVQGDESRNDGKRTMGSMGGEISMGGAFLEAAEDEARLAKKSRQAMRTMGSVGGERSMGGAFLEAAEDEARLAKKSRQAMLDHVGSGKYSAEDFARADPGDWKVRGSRTCDPPLTHR